MIELFVNNTLIDLAPGEVIVLSKSIGRIGEFSLRGGLFTNDFTIQWTAQNIKTLGFHDKTTSASTFPYIKQDAVLKQRGSELSRGFVQLTEVNTVDRTASISFYGDNSNWFNLLGNASIRDLDLSDLDHNWTEANIVASWNQTDGYVYPFVDPGTFDAKATNATDITDWYPAVYRKTIVERIFDRIGYKLSGSFLDYWAYKQAIIPVVRMVDSANTNNFAYGRNTVVQQFAEASNAVSGSISADLEFNTTNSASDFTTATNIFTASTTGDISLTFLGEFQNIAWENFTFPSGLTPFAQMEVWIDILQNGSLVEDILIERTDDANELPQTPDYSLNYTRLFTVAPGDTIKAQIRFEWDGFTSPVQILAVDYAITGFEIQTQDIEVDSNLDAGQEIDIAYNLPDISQKDFIKEMIVMHGLTVETDNYSQTVSFEPAETVLSKLSDAPDWTGKVDSSRYGEIDFVEVVQNYGRQTFFLFAEDSEDVKLADYKLINEKQYGQGLVEIPNDFLAAAHTFWQSVFAPTVTVRTWTTFSTNGVYQPFIPRFDADGDRVEPAPRILYYVGRIVNSAFSGPGFSIDGTTYSSMGWAYFEKPTLSALLDAYKESLAWQTPAIANPSTAGLLERYYTRVVRIWNRPRYITLSIRLEEFEYQNLDFRQPVFIDTLNISGYFVIDEVEDYDGRLAQVNLIQVE